MSQVTAAHYGKARIPVVKIERDHAEHRLFQAMIAVDTEGEHVVEAYTRGDNSAIVPTDTMKNLVYALVLQHALTSIEDLARFIGQEHLRRYATMSQATVTVDQIPWEPLRRAGAAERLSPISFRRAGGEEPYTTVAVRRGSVAIESGVRHLTLLKTTDSAFSGFPVDEFTTLPPTEDRVLATNLSGHWKLEAGDLDYDRLRREILDTIVVVFAELHSRSVQHLAHDMAAAVLERCQAVTEISLRLPNLHCNLLDLSRFGLVNADVVYLPTDSPHGDLHVTMTR